MRERGWWKKEEEEREREKERERKKKREGVGQRERWTEELSKFAMVKLMVV